MGSLTHLVPVPRAEDLAVRSPQLDDSIVLVIRHPDVGPVKGHAIGEAPRYLVPARRTEDLAVRSPQLGDSPPAGICHPNVGTVKRNAYGVRAHGEACCPVGA